MTVNLGEVKANKKNTAIVLQNKYHYIKSPCHTEYNVFYLFFVIISNIIFIVYRQTVELWKYIKNIFTTKTFKPQ